MTHSSLWSVWHDIVSSEFFDYSMKSLLLSAVVIATALLGMRDAVSHTRWFCLLGFGGLLALAVSYYIVPHVKIPILPARAGSELAASVPSSTVHIQDTTNEPGPELLQVRIGVEVQAPGARGSDHDGWDNVSTISRASSGSLPAYADAAQSPTAPRIRRLMADLGAMVWHRSLLTAWVVGLLAAAAWWMIGAAQLRIRVRRTEPAPAEITNLCDQLCEQIALATKVAVRIADDNCMPFVYGAGWKIGAGTKSAKHRKGGSGIWYFTPLSVIVLPVQSRAWPESKWTSILLHELAHLRLGDLAAKKWLRLASALNWWNPLIGVLSRLHGNACERACDQLVLGSGVHAVDYADHLLAVVMQCRRVRHAPATVSTSSDLRARISAIVQTTQPISFVSSKSHMALAILAIVALVLPLSAARLSARPQLEHPSLHGAAQSALQHLSSEPGPPQPEPLTAEPKASHQKSTDTFVISASGTIIDEQKVRVTGASVFLRLVDMTNHTNALDPTFTGILAETRTDAKGAFEFNEIPDLPVGRDHTDRDHRWMFIVMKPGHAMGWQTLATRNVSNVRISLPREHVVPGTVVDEEGAPISGAKVQLWQLFNSTSLDDTILRNAQSVNLEHFPALPTATTDADGKFRLCAIPPNSGVFFVVEHDEYARAGVLYSSAERESSSTTTSAVASGIRDRKPITESILRFHRDDDVKLVMSRGQRVTAIVLSQDDDTPIPNAKVVISAPGTTLKKTFVTNSNGEFQTSRFDAKTLPPPIRVHVAPPAGFLKVEQPIEVEKDQPELSTTIRVPRGLVVSGRVIDHDQGHPLGGVKVALAPADASAPRWAGTWYATSQADGTFQVTVSPGRYRVFPMGPVPGYFAPQAYGERVWLEHRARSEVKPPPDGFEQTIEIRDADSVPQLQVRVHRGLVIRGVVRDGNGRSVAGAVVKASRMPAQNFYQSVSDGEGRFELSGLFPGGSYALVATHDDENLSGRLVINASPFETPASGSIKQRIEADIAVGKMGSVRGQVVLGDEPYAGLVVRLHSETESNSTMRMSTVLASGQTDSQGRFELNNIMPGRGLVLDVKAPVPGWHFRGEPFTLEPGETLEHPVVRFEAHDREITGRVVDTTGRPLAGVRVSVSDDFGVIADFNGQNTTSDEDGKFVFRQIPHTRLRLDANASNYQPGTFSASLLLEPTDDRVRVVLDPRLIQPVNGVSPRKE